MAISATRPSATGRHIYIKGQVAEAIPLQSGELFPFFDGVNANLLVSLGFATREVETDGNDRYTRWTIKKNCTLDVILKGEVDRSFTDKNGKTTTYKKKLYDVVEVDV